MEALINLAVIAVAIWAFIKFCSFAKRFTIPGKVKTAAYILVGLAAFAMNYLFSSAKEGQGTDAVMTDPTMMAVAWGLSMAVVLFFSFALMAETKE